MGVVVGDEEMYEIFVELFDLIIEECYNGFKKMDLYKIDLDLFKICGGRFDVNYVLFFCVCIGRFIRGLSLLLYCLRVERRKIEKIVIRVFGGLRGMFLS